MKHDQRGQLRPRRMEGFDPSASMPERPRAVRHWRGQFVAQILMWRSRKTLAKVYVMGTVVAIRPVETPNLVLREIERGDAMEFAGFMTQPRYQRHITHRLKTEAMVKDFVARQVAAQHDTRRQVYHLAAEEKVSGEVVGDGFLIVHGNGSHEIGWGVHPAMWSMGLGTEIGRALLAVGFERLKAQSLWCKVMAENAASAKLARRIGMEAKIKRDDFPLGQGRTAPVDIFVIPASRYFDLPY